MRAQRPSIAVLVSAAILLAHVAITPLEAARDRGADWVEDAHPRADGLVPLRIRAMSLGGDRVSSGGVRADAGVLPALPALATWREPRPVEVSRVVLPAATAFATGFRSRAPPRA